MANGEEIDNLGEKQFVAHMVTTEGGDSGGKGITAQVCNVHRPLMSAKKICKAGYKIVFDDDDSISELNPKVRSMELNRLREENSELKDKLMQLKTKMESADGRAAPLGMTTFSPARES